MKFGGTSVADTDRIKNAALRELASDAGRLARTLPNVAYRHVRRHENALADSLVNEALDAV